MPRPVIQRDLNDPREAVASWCDECQAYHPYQTLSSGSRVADVDVVLVGDGNTPTEHERDLRDEGMRLVSLAYWESRERQRQQREERETNTYLYPTSTYVNQDITTPESRAAIPTAEQLQEIVWEFNQAVDAGVHYSTISQPNPLTENNPVPSASQRARTHDDSTNPPRRLRKLRCRHCNELKKRDVMGRLDGSFIDGRGVRFERPWVCDGCRESRLIRMCGHTETDQGGCGVWVHRSRTRQMLDRTIRCHTCLSNAVQCRHCRLWTTENRGTEAQPFCANCIDQFQECGDCHNLRGAEDIRITNLRNAEGRQVCGNCSHNYGQCRTCRARHLHTAMYEDEDSGNLYCQAHAPNFEDPNYEWNHDGRYINAIPERFPGATRFSRTKGSARSFGIELEFARSGRAAARYIVKKTKWGAGPDGTSGVVQEFKSPILNGDEGLENAELFSDLANRTRLDVSRACGFHLHLNMREMEQPQIARIAAACQTFLPVFRAVVPPSRRRNRYCNADRGNGSPKDLLDGKIVAHRANPDRYATWNWQAYNKCGSLENRLHTGTMNKDKIINWVLANMHFVDWAADASVDEILRFVGKPATEQFAFLSQGIWPEPIANFYHGRALKFGFDLRAPFEVDAVREPRNPDDPGWEWTEDDFRIVRYNLGEPSDRNLRYAYRMRYLSRMPTPDNEETTILAVPVPNYREDEQERDP